MGVDGVGGVVGLREGTDLLGRPAVSILSAMVCVCVRVCVCVDCGIRQEDRGL